MKYTNLIAALATSLCFSVTAQAAGSPWYLGVKAGQMMVDVDGLDDASNIGITGGYRLANFSLGSFALEAEYSNSTSKGEAKILNFTGDWDVKTLAFYGVYRSAGDVYFKGKAGYLDEDVSITIAGFSVAGSDSGLSLGLGGGWRISASSSLEVEYTVIEEDIDFLSIGYNYNF